MKMTLTQSIIINKLSIDVKPDLDQQGRVVYLPNPERKPYIITDNHRDSPVGFGVKISATKNLYHSTTGGISRQATLDGWQGTETGYQIYDW